MAFIPKNKWLQTIMRIRKLHLGKNVLDATYERIEWIFDTFSEVCLSFSGGKDSSTLFHLLAEVARRKNKKFKVLFIDWEVQFSATIQHVTKMKEMYTDVTSAFLWVALPLTTVSGVSQYQPEWVCWEKDAEWIRQPPPDAITDYEYFPFYKYAMTFENFVPEVSGWMANNNKGLITLTGIRADESLNRFLGLTSLRKLRYADDKPWTTAAVDGHYYTAYPLYDWKVKDIWLFHSRSKLPYNQLYDLMYRAGVPMKLMRVCEPFGTEQRRGLWLYHILEPDTWGKACSRVSGANSGAMYANQTGNFYAVRTPISKPLNHTWRSYALFLLDSMPVKTAEHYRNKIAIYLRWCKDHGYEKNIPDEQEKDLGARDIPSWRRICKTIIKNDFWCRTLSFSPNKPQHYERYLKRIQQKRKEWQII